MNNNIPDNQRYQNQSVFSNIVWKFLERGSSVIVTLVINIVLARILAPEIHGLLAMVTVFVTISEIFVTAGLGSALIQKQDADELDFSTIFWLNLIVSLFIYVLIFFSSPVIASFFGYDELIAILRVLGIRIIISAINSIQCAYIARAMLFKHYFLSTLVGKLVSGILGILMAFMGFGVWALVFQTIFLTLIETLVLWFRVKWRPSMCFSWERGKSLYRFAYKVMLTSFVETITDQFRNLIIGKQYSSAELAYYNKGVLFPNSLTTNVTSALSAVMYPVLANRQNSLKEVRSACRRWISLFAYCMFPILAGFAATANNLVPLLLTNKWVASVPYLQIACGIYASWVVEVPIREAIKSVGKADICLLIQIIKTSVSIISLIIVYQFGVLSIALTALFCGCFNIIISALFGRKYLDYTIKMLLQDILPTLILCICMSVCVLLVPIFFHKKVVCVVLQIIIGVITYCAGSVLTKNKSFTYLINIIKRNVSR